LKKLIKVLKKKERSLRWLSRQLGVHYMTVQHWKKSKNGVPDWHKDKICKVLNVSKKDLFSEKN
jgi:lambda repressor-like predicted transcriptional regulator